MNNLIYASIDITCHETKTGDLYITSMIKIPARDKKTGKIQELILKPKRNKELKLEAWQLLCLAYGKEMDHSNPTLKLTKVQTYLLKGNEEKPYYLIRLRLFEGISLSIFLSNMEINIVTNFVKLDGEFEEKGNYEILPFENSRKA